ncbi:MAG: methyl-accepting chemotaxis protein [Breznakibacter sp.]
MKKKRTLAQTMLLFVGFPIFIIYFASVMFFATNGFNKTIRNAESMAQSNARDIAKQTEKLLNKEVNMATSMASLFLGIKDEAADKRLKLCSQMSSSLLADNPDFLGVWYNWQLFTVNKDWSQPHGRVRTSFFYHNGQIESKRDTLDKNGENKEGLYYKIKQLARTITTDPYMESYQGRFDHEVMTTSVCVPMIADGLFLGLVGMDISLERYKQVINSFDKDTYGQVLLFSSDGQIIASNETKKTGLFIHHTDSALVTTTDLYESLKANDQINALVDTGHDKLYYSIVPITLGQSPLPWGLAVMKSYSLITEAPKNQLTTFIVTGILGMLLIMAIVYMLLSRVIKPIKSLAKVAIQISNGNLHTETAVSNFAELDQTGTAMNDMAYRLRKIVSNIRENAQQIDESSEQLKSEVTNLTERASTQASTVEEVSTSMSEILMASHQNTQYAGQTIDEANHAAKQTSMSSVAVQETNHTSDAIAKEILAIKEITTQTQILSLNAAIEASRAGHHGKGFAVVAAEVRKLAERTRELSDKIIKLSQHNSQNAADAARGLMVTEPAIAKISQSIQAIATQSKMQDNAVSQVNIAIDGLNRYAQENAIYADRMLDFANNLKTKSAQLNEQMEFFKLSN